MSENCGAYVLCWVTAGLRWQVGVEGSPTQGRLPEGKECRAGMGGQTRMKAFYSELSQGRAYGSFAYILSGWAGAG